MWQLSDVKQPRHICCTSRSCGLPMGKIFWALIFFEGKKFPEGQTAGQGKGLYSHCSPRLSLPVVRVVLSCRGGLLPGHCGGVAEAAPSWNKGRRALWTDAGRQASSDASVVFHSWVQGCSLVRRFLLIQCWCPSRAAQEVTIQSGDTMSPLWPPAQTAGASSHRVSLHGWHDIASGGVSLQLVPQCHPNP